MKFMLWSYLLVASLLTTSCSLFELESEDVGIWEAGSQEFGFAKGKKNGKDFEASVVSYFAGPPYDDRLVIWFFTYSKEGYERESLSISKAILLQRATYQLVLKYESEEARTSENITKTFYHISQDDGDVSGDRYLLKENEKNNELEVTEVNTTLNLMKGRLRATFMHTHPDSKIFDDSPNEVKFDFEFEIKIPK